MKPSPWRRQRGGAAALAVAVGLSACSGPRPPLPERPRQTRLTKPSAVGAASSVPSSAPSRASTHDSAFERHVAELEHALNVFDSAVATNQVPPSRFSVTQLERRTKRPFPAAAYDHVLVFIDWADWGPVMTFNKPGPVFGALTDTGTLASSAVLPGVPVSDDHVAELLKLINAQPLNHNLRYGDCEGCSGPRHSYVFYDAGNSPVAVLVVVLDSSEWWSYPDIGHNSAYLTSATPEFRESYSALCERIGSGLCFYHDEDYAARVFSARADRHREPATPFGPRNYQPSPLSYVPDVPLDTLSVLERRKLCAWAHRRLAWQPQCPNLNDSSTFRGMETPDGALRWTGCSLAWYQCERERFDCPRTLSEVLPCEERALAGDPGFLADAEGPQARQCRAMRDCIWGYKTAHAPQ